MSLALRLVETRARKDQLRELTASAKLHGWTLRAVAAIAALVGGILAAISGSMVTAVSWIEGDGVFLHHEGTLLLFLTIPLLILGAHLLDLQEAASKRNSQHEKSRNQ